MKCVRVEISVSRVLSSSEVLKPRWLDDELIKDRLNWLWTLPPHHVHLASTWHHSGDEFSQAFHVFFTTLSLLCIIVNANQRAKNRDSLGTRLYILVFPSPDTSHPEGLPREQRTRKRQSLFKLVPCGVFTEIYLLAISLLSHYLASWGPWFLWPLPEKVDEGLLVEDFHGMFFTNLPQNQVQNHIILLFSNFGREIW